MKTTFIRTDKKNKRYLKWLSIDETIEIIKGENYLENVESLREYCHWNYQFSPFNRMHRLPVVCPSAELKADKDGNLTMKKFNGLLTLTIGTVSNQDEAENVKRLAAMLPMTVLAVCGSSGRTVKVVVRISRQDGTLPHTEDEAVRLCTQAYPLASQLYETIARYAGTANMLTVGPALRQEHENVLLAGFRMTCDGQPYYNDNAASLKVSDELPIGTLHQPVSVSDDTQPGANDSTIGRETRQLIELLEHNYAFRMNKVMGYVEYRSKAKPYYLWQPVDEHAQNTMAMEARLAGINIWDKDVNRYIKSNMIRKYDPSRFDRQMGRARPYRCIGCHRSHQQRELAQVVPHVVPGHGGAVAGARSPLRQCNGTAAHLEAGLQQIDLLQAAAAP